MWPKALYRIIITPVNGYNLKPHLQCVTLAPWGASTRSAYSGDNNITHNLFHIPPGTHIYTWVESSNVDKLSC